MTRHLFTLDIDPVAKFLRFWGSAKERQHLRCTCGWGCEVPPGADGLALGRAHVAAMNRDQDDPGDTASIQEALAAPNKAFNDLRAAVAKLAEELAAVNVQAGLETLDSVEAPKLPPDTAWIQTETVTGSQFPWTKGT